MPDFHAHHQLQELAQTHVYWVSDNIQLSPPLLFPSPPTFNLSQHQCLFKWVSSSHQLSKVLEFHLQHQLFQWILGLISIRIDWLDLLAVQGTLKSLLQHYSSKASILWCSAFFIVQHSHPYVTTRKTIALTRQTFICKAKDMILKDEFPRSVGAQYATGEDWRNNSRNNEDTEPKWKQCPVVNVTGDGSKIQCCKEQYCTLHGNLEC